MNYGILFILMLLLAPSYILHYRQCLQQQQADSELLDRDVCVNPFDRELFKNSVDCVGAQDRLQLKAEYCAFFMVWSNIRNHYFYALPAVLFVIYVWWRQIPEKRKKKKREYNEIVPYH